MSARRQNLVLLERFICCPFSYGLICRKIGACLLLLPPLFLLMSINLPPNWPTLNPCAAARSPNVLSGAANPVALAPRILKRATVPTSA